MIQRKKTLNYAKVTADLVFSELILILGTLYLFIKKIYLSQNNMYNKRINAIE